MIFDRKSSMRKHLILMFIGTSIVLHVIVGAIIQYTVQTHFYDQDYQHITEKFLAIKRSYPEVDFNEEVVKSFELSALEAWVIEGDTLGDKNAKVILPKEAVSFLLNTQDTKHSWEWQQGNNRYLAFSFAWDIDKTLVVGININHHIDFFKVINLVIFWSILAALLLTGLYSIFIVNRGLRPLKKFEYYLAKVSPGRLDIRIPTQELPAELEALGNVQNAMLDRLDHGFQRLSDFSSDIAHELRTPLSNMTTQTEVILSNNRELEEYQDTLGSNLEELERISKTINDTLYLAKSENSLLYQNNKQLNLTEQISILIEYHEIAGEENGVSIELEGQGEFFCDESMFQRAMNNLLSNAIRHASDNSTIKVIIEQTDSELLIGVTNHGDTIPEGSLPFIFDRFYRADKSREHTYSVGAGLGLAITQSIIEAYGGTISAKSSDGFTEFWITFENIPLSLE